MNFISDSAKKLKSNTDRDVFRHKLRMAYNRGLPQSPSLDVDGTLKLLSKQILQKVRAHIKQSAFSLRARRRLDKALKIELKPNSVMLVAVDPLWNYLVGGRKQRQMSWLSKATKPIPIVTESGDVIFRSATAKSMADGKWVFPGRQPLNLLDRAVKESREVIKKKLAKEMVKNLKKSMR